MTIRLGLLVTNTTARRKTTNINYRQGSEIHFKSVYEYDGWRGELYELIKGSKKRYRILKIYEAMEKILRKDWNKL